MINDGNTIGSFVEKSFKQNLSDKYDFGTVDLIVGIDFPEINVDLKTSKSSQPQSSCPYRLANQKIFWVRYRRRTGCNSSTCPARRVYLVNP